jgi:hypothetical protein
MFFSSDLKTQGRGAKTPNVKKDSAQYVTNKIGDEECISLALSFYGYGVIVARIYEEAINKL